MLVAVLWAVNISLTPYAMKLIIDRVSDWKGEESLFSAVLYPALFYVGLCVVVGLVFRFYDWLLIKTFPSMKVRITEEMFRYIENHSYSYFQQNFTGNIANKINDMSRSSAVIVKDSMENFLSRILSLIIGSVTMFLVHPYFALVLIIWSIIFISLSIILSKRAQKYSAAFSHTRSTIVGKIVDSIGNILNVKLFARENYERGYLSKWLEDSATKDRKVLWYLLKVKAFYALSITCLSAAMMWLLIEERSQGRITVGDFALILTLNMFLIEEVFFLANQLVPFSEELGTCRQALSVISPKHEVVDLPEADDLTIVRGEIVFERVHFRYKHAQSIFTDKSITIHAGERVGLVGLSGSGKSTFIHLILRFFDVDSGRILIDGQDVKMVTQSSLRSQIGMIPQDPILFHRSLMENIAYGKLDASEEEIISASKRAHCHEFIEKLPEGYQTLVGERGAKLSGGQKQRIAIARAMLKNAPILILDEATSSLDSITENDIQESLNDLMEERTTLVVAHRLSTLLHMDRILVFSKGLIIEEGRHAELLKLNGHYAGLWNAQTWVEGFCGSSSGNDSKKSDEIRSGYRLYQGMMPGSAPKGVCNNKLDTP